MVSRNPCTIVVGWGWRLLAPRGRSEKSVSQARDRGLLLKLRVTAEGRSLRGHGPVGLLAVDL